MQLRPEQPALRDQTEAFITRWSTSSAAERANFQPFASEPCDILNVPRPEPATSDPARDRYRFEYPVRFQHPDGSTSTGSIHRRSAFVMEAKQGSDQQFEEQLALFGGTEIQTRKGSAVRGTRNWAAAMQRARGQAERYAKALPVEHGWPPVLATAIPTRWGKLRRTWIPLLPSRTAFLRLGQLCRAFMLGRRAVQPALEGIHSLKSRISAFERRP